MILADLKSLKTGRRELRNFGLLVGGVFLGIALLLWARGSSLYLWCAAPGAALVALGAVAPRMLKYPYLGWMALALVLGFVVSHVILTLFFFGVITVVGLIARLAGKDFLRLKLDPGARSYWIPREQRGTQPAAEYERQF